MLFLLKIKRSCALGYYLAGLMLKLQAFNVLSAFLSGASGRTLLRCGQGE